MAEERYRLTKEGKEAVKKALKSLPKTKTSPGFVDDLNKQIAIIERRKRMKTVNSILDWLMPRDFRSYWSHWFMLTYFAIGCIIHCPEVVRAIMWPLVIFGNWWRG